MPYLFDITPIAFADLDANRQGKILFTVHNTSGKPVHARAVARASQPEAQSWLNLEEESERHFLTDETGTFYIFLPSNADTNWTVSYLSLACTSNQMDASCNCLNNACGKPNPENMTIKLPDDALINFTWVIP